jgi:hypothetical protein
MCAHAEVSGFCLAIAARTAQEDADATEGGLHVLEDAAQEPVDVEEEPRGQRADFIDDDDGGVAEAPSDRRDLCVADVAEVATDAEDVVDGEAAPEHSRRAVV